MEEELSIVHGSGENGNCEAMFNVQVHDSNWNEKLARRRVMCNRVQLEDELRRWMDSQRNGAAKTTTRRGAVLPNETLTVECFYVA